MLPGPTLIVKPHLCSSPVQIDTIASGNTFGATHWTDGKMYAPYLPDNPWLRKNPTDGVLFWTGEWDVLSRSIIPLIGSPSAPYAMRPTEEEYFTALESGVANTPEKLIYIRKRIWWLGNDLIRDIVGHRLFGFEAAPACIEGSDKNLRDGLPPRHLENLEALVELLPAKPANSRLMKAEALRELGRFKEARKLLRKPLRIRLLYLYRVLDRFRIGPYHSVLSYRRSASFIEDLCLAQNTNVAQFP